MIVMECIKSETDKKRVCRLMKKKIEVDVGQQGKLKAATAYRPSGIRPIREGRDATSLEPHSDSGPLHASLQRGTILTGAFAWSRILERQRAW